jgi:hypothetical protein
METRGARVQKEINRARPFVCNCEIYAGTFCNSRRVDSAPKYIYMYAKSRRELKNMARVRELIKIRESALNYSCAYLDCMHFQSRVESAPPIEIYSLCCNLWTGPPIRRMRVRGRLKSRLLASQRGEKFSQNGYL